MAVFGSAVPEKRRAAPLFRQCLLHCFRGCPEHHTSNQHIPLEPGMRPVPLRRKLCCQGSLLAFPGHSRLSQDAQTSLCPQPCTFGSKAFSASAAVVCVALLPRCRCQRKDPESQEAVVKCRHRVIGLCWAPRSASPTSRASLPGKGVSSDSDSLRSFLLLRECSCCRARTSDENCEAAPPLRPRHQSSASDSASPASTKAQQQISFLCCSRPGPLPS